MFTKKITDDDNFMNLSASSQALYLHLSMSADDDGFCNQVTLSMFKAHASVQDLQALLENRYIYQFENGVIVIKHWRMANTLRKDRYTETVFKEELAKLELKENGSYSWLPNGCQTVAACLPQYSIDKNSIDKNNIYNTPQKIKKESPPKTYGSYNNIQLSVNDIELLKKEFPTDWSDRIESVSSWYHNKGLSCTNGAAQVRNWKMRGAKTNGKYGKDDNQEHELEIFEQYNI